MGSGRPPVSVVLPTYNRADVVGRSIESVLDQTYTDFELIVVDDASSDGTDGVIEGFGDDRIRHVEHDENSGAAAARNTGIRMAEGDIVAFQDSDDTWAKNKLARQVAAFEDADSAVGVVYTGTWRKRDGSQTYIPGAGVDPKEGNVHESLLTQNFVTPQAAAVRAECFDRVGTFDERLPPLEDWELWIRISEQYEFRFVDEPLVTAYLRTDSISRDDEQKVQARELIVRKHRERFDREKLANQLFWIGHGYLKSGRTTKGRKYLLAATRTDLQPLYLGALLLSVLGSNTYRETYQFYKSVSG